MSSEVKNVLIKKVYPLASELSSVNTNVKCMEEGCNNIFTSESNLSMHMLKCHKKQSLTKNEDCIIHHHCPETSCIYHNVRHFKKLKYLKQHYLKVHADKNFICETCNKGFSTLAIKNTHSEVCGVTFTCLECPNTYKSYESLLTHGRRKKHAIAEKSVFCKKPLIIELNKSVSEVSNKIPHILPKQSTSMQTIRIIPIVVHVKSSNEQSDKGIQTEPCGDAKFRTKPVKRRSNIYTQTCKNKKVRRSAETQTIGDCILKKAIQDAKVSLEENEDDNKLKKCIETQTKDTNWVQKGFGENYTQTGIELKSDPSDITLDSLSNEDIMSSSSRTSVNSMNFFDDTFGNCQQTQTDILYQDEFLQSSFIAHIETQTNDEIDLCSNMYTQTCDDQLLSDFGFSNIQTQTTWPDYDLFVSTETQTLLTQNTKTFFDIPMSAREISHMETQTDMEFKQLLEEINA